VALTWRAVLAVAAVVAAGVAACHPPPRASPGRGPAGGRPAEARVADTAPSPAESGGAEAREESVYVAVLEDDVKTRARAKGVLEGRGDTAGARALGATAARPLYVAAEPRRVFASEAVARDWAEAHVHIYWSVPASAVRAFALANVPAGPTARPRRVRLPAEIAGQAVVVTDSSVHQLNGGWAGGSPARVVYVLSRAGFSAGGDTAVVQVAHTCGGLCGGGMLLLVVRGPGGWARAGILELWAS
jgi:hypothetical protein